ncbi:MAG TPA: 2-C-methyl-D-erythritol 2,4-cyclodiphosphate synthase [Thermoanaerobacterales bacterium]|nr:2-C-methyl-D-erythritol 2,4-cyclodiphosphate synthase [Thermoanaerobacterales bacterium]
MFKVGMGFDVHPLIEGRDLVICGVKIPYHKGLDGHSDADVATHAIIDSIIGALGLGDIGRFFPDNDPSYKNISSLILLEKVRNIISDKGYKINNIDVVIAAEEPKLIKYFDQMVNNISKTLDINERKINVKATTTEGMSFIGRCEGIASFAVSTLTR